MSNPFFRPLLAHGVPDFPAIRTEHYLEAFVQGFAEQDSEIQAILASPDKPTFENTVEALETSGRLLERVGAVFWNLASSDSSEELRALELELSPRLASHRSRIYSNPGLFERVRTVHEETGDALTGERRQLLLETYRAFVRAGAELETRDRERVTEIAGRLASLTTRFSQNVLRDANSFELVLEDGDDVAGLPGFVLAAAREEAEARGRSGKYLFTISRSSITPFLQYAESRALREHIFTAYTQCGRSLADNRPLILQIIALRQEKAALLGFASHADFMLDDRMAAKPAAVRELLDLVWEPCQARLAEEAAALQASILEEGDDFSLQAWDWWFYTEKVRQRVFELDEAALKPYFRLANVRDGAFEVAGRLYGIRFTPADLPLYHPDVEAYEVTDRDGEALGVFLFDFFARPSKRSGAWMSTFRDQSNLDGHQRPVIVNCCNFPKAEPCLLGVDEVRTLFHEFGHGLHGLFSRVRYRSLSGTAVKQDFVELPSQIMEHWAMEPEVLTRYARHYETGEALPPAMIENLKQAATFNQGFATAEYLAACYLDMAWHQAGGAEATDVDAFEEQVLGEMSLIGAVQPRYRSTYFQHIFSSDYYSAGYYVYLWAEVLDADGYEAFREKGLFDQATARSFRECILEKGGSEDPMSLYRQFRGRDPDVGPLLKNRGLGQ
jgi:peptidyl-dipeptidase Dcp